jgi:hypothetical protein
LDARRIWKPINNQQLTKEMNYLTSDTNTLIWLWFTLYTFSVLFLIPLPFNLKEQTNSLEATNEKALQFASRLIVRTVLVFPMLFLLKDAV